MKTITKEIQCKGINIQLDYVVKNDDSQTGRLVATLLGNDGIENEMLHIDVINIEKCNQREKFTDSTWSKIPRLKRTVSVKDKILLALVDIAVELMSVLETLTSPIDTAIETIEDALDKLSPEAIESAWCMLRSDDLFEQISRDIKRMGITGEVIENRTIYVVMTSRYLLKPLQIIIQGCSGSGKSYKIEIIATLIPPRDRVMAHDFSPTSMAYLPEGSLKHKVIISGERTHNKRGREGQAQDNTKVFRELAASGYYNKYVTTKDTKTGEYKSVKVEQEGPIAYLESTTATYIPDEDSTRLIKLNTNESPELTGKIQNSQKQGLKGYGVSEEDKTKIIEKHHALQLLLGAGLSKSPKITIPFIDHITLPNNVVHTRRTLPYVGSVISTVAFLRQFHPSKAGNKKSNLVSIISGAEKRPVIVADKEDYRIAYEILRPMLDKMYKPLPDTVKNLFNTIIEKTRVELPKGTMCFTGAIRKNKKIKRGGSKFGWKEFTVKECKDWLGVSNTETWRRLKSLHFTGVIHIDDTKKPHVCQVVKPELIDTVNILGNGVPTPDEMDKLIAADSHRSKVGKKVCKKVCKKMSKKVGKKPYRKKTLPMGVTSFR